MVPVAALVLFAGVALPISIASRTPIGAEPLMSCKAVTTARPRLFVPRSGSIATAIGPWSIEIDVEVSEVAGVEESNGVRLICETVLLAVLAIRAAPVPSLMATPVGLVPTVTSVTACLKLTISMTEAVPAELFATTARPNRGLRAIP